MRETNNEAKLNEISNEIESCYAKIKRLKEERDWVLNPESDYVGKFLKITGRNKCDDGIMKITKVVFNGDKSLHCIIGPHIYLDGTCICEEDCMYEDVLGQIDYKFIDEYEYKSYLKNTLSKIEKMFV